VASASAYVLAAPARATFVLTNGERKSGEVVFHGGNAANFIDGQLNLGDGSKEQSYPIDQVAVIDFAGGTPAQAELAKIPSTGQIVVLRDGNAIPGSFVNIVRGDTLVWDNNGQQQQIPVNNVARVYLNGQSARTAFNYTGPAASAVTGTSGSAAGRSVRVNGNQAWTDTGITVNQGDRVSFQSSGEITYGRSAGQTATPDGGAEHRPNYPDPTAPVGALIGKVGNSPAFGIGSQTQPLVMPASGRLMLGVNDNELADNGGAFTVVVTKQ
jgi:hypothetical protein